MEGFFEEISLSEVESQPDTYELEPSSEIIGHRKPDSPPKPSRDQGDQRDQRRTFNNKKPANEFSSSNISPAKKKRNSRVREDTPTTTPSGFGDMVVRENRNERHRDRDRHNAPMVNNPGKKRLKAK